MLEGLKAWLYKKQIESSAKAIMKLHDQEIARRTKNLGKDDAERAKARQWHKDLDAEIDRLEKERAQ